MRLVVANLQPVWLDGRPAAPSGAVVAPVIGDDAVPPHNFRTAQARTKASLFAFKARPVRLRLEENQEL
jgi:hypothetical protein